jgi:RNA polymerase sigma-70 factor (sigma-E family)
MADDDDFVAFVRGYSGTLYRTAYLLTGSSAAAEDLLQDTLARLYPRWDRVRGADSPLAYVRRSLANGFVSSYRRRKHEVLSGDEVHDGWDGRDLSNAVADRDLVSQLLADLPVRQRAAVVMRYLHDMPDEQIATSIGCRPATVRSLISRAMSAMRTDVDRIRIPAAGPSAPVATPGQENAR